MTDQDNMPHVEGLLENQGQLGLVDPVFKWGVINRTNNSNVGDCEQRDGTLTLLADGTASWSCFVLTYHTHSGDKWKSGFELRDANDVVLAESDFITGPEHMDDGNPQPVYPWNDTIKFNKAYDRFAVAKIYQYPTC